MNTEIFLVLTILVVAILLFISEKLRVDVVALIVLSSLVVTGLITPDEALSGFSNPAVITVWAVFILSGGLSQTGIANKIGKYVLQLAGEGEIRLLVVIMLTSGLMSAFMNNIGVAALLLPVILDIGRRTKRPPSKLLLPLVFGALLGGMLTLIGTPPNILISEALSAEGLRPFSFFDYSGPGLALLLAGIAYMVLVGRRLLPTRDPVQELAGRKHNLESQEILSDALAELRLTSDNGLAGKTLAESRIGRALGLNILAVIRNGRRQLAPRPETILQEGDSLLVLGRLDRLEQLSQQPNLLVEEEHVALGQLLSGPMGIAEFRVEADTPYQDRTLADLDLRRVLGINVLAIRREGKTVRQNLLPISLKPDDWLIIQGEKKMLDVLQYLPDFRILDEDKLEAYGMPTHFLVVGVPEGSPIVGHSLAESRLGQTFGLTALSLIRGDQPQVLPEPDRQLVAGDYLIVMGAPRDLDIVRGLQGLSVNRQPDIDVEELSRGPVALVEAILSPFTTLTDKSLEALQFRERYGLNVVAIWRGGQARYSNLGEMQLRLGDALLLYGPREKINQLGREPDFLVMHEEAQAELRLDKAPIAGLLMAGVIATVLMGWLPISAAAVIGATLMVLTNCLDMEEAYRFIEWKAVFLIAGMLPLGVAMDKTGAAAFLAEAIISAAGDFGPHMMLSVLYILSVLATVFMPNPVVAVLLAPIALNSAADLGVSPYTLMMGIAFGASTSFLSPVGHPANVLVMGPGGYRFTDYIKAGLPLVLILLVVVVLVVPVFWPFTG